MFPWRAGSPLKVSSANPVTETRRNTICAVGRFGKEGEVLQCSPPLVHFPLSSRPTLSALRRDHRPVFSTPYRTTSALRESLRRVPGRTGKCSQIRSPMADSYRAVALIMALSHPRRRGKRLERVSRQPRHLAPSRSRGASHESTTPQGTAPFFFQALNISLCDRRQDR